MSGIISTPRHTNPFESSRRLAEDGTEYWSSRDLSAILGYADYRNFEQAISRAKEACAKSGHRIQDHFGDSTDMIDLGKGAQRQIPVVFLSRYACYVGKKVRQTIAELGGTMPENLPTVESIKKLESTGRKKELS